MPLSFKVNVDAGAIRRTRAARAALHGQLDKVTDDPRYKAAYERFRFMDHRMIAVAAREERRRAKEEMLR